MSKTALNHHSNLLGSIREVSQKPPRNFNLPKYLGSIAENYFVTTIVKRQIAKDWARENKSISSTALVQLLNKLFKGKSFDEKSIASYILSYLPDQRKNLELKHIDKWLTHLNGWAEIDTLCQSTFSSDEFLDRWAQWKKLLRGFSKSKNISKRRASLVLLTKPVRELTDKKISKLAFENIDRLKSEEDILITKAVSWLLRELIKNHKSQVGSYIKINKELLPKIALRETKRKLETGKK